MEGRLKKLLVGGVLIGLIGCGHTRNKNSTPSVPSHGSTAEPPLVSNKSDGRFDKGPVKVETLNAFAAVRLQAANSPNRDSRERDQLCQEAITTYQQVLKRDAKNVDAMMGMARAYKGMNEKDRCVEWYTKATKQAPNNAQIRGEMGQSLDSLKDREAAINCYHQATKIDPVNKDYRKALGFALARAGRYEEASAWLNRCMAPADAHVAIGRMMDHNGQRDQATQHYAMALKVDPNNETARLAINNQAAPLDRIPEGLAIQTVSYEQAQPIARAPMPAAPAPTQAPVIAAPAPVPAPAVKGADPVPMFMNRSGAQPPQQGWMQAR